LIIEESSASELGVVDFVELRLSLGVRSGDMEGLKDIIQVVKNEKIATKARKSLNVFDKPLGVQEMLKLRYTVTGQCTEMIAMFC
jgi:hypothetical protein